MGHVLSESTTTIVNVIIILGSMYGALRWLRKWLQNEVAVPLANKLETLTAYAEQTREIAVEANTAARMANERLNSMHGG